MSYEYSYDITVLYNMSYDISVVEVYNDIQYL